MTLRGLDFQRSGLSAERGWWLLAVGIAAGVASLTWHAAVSSERAAHEAALREAQEATRRALAASRVKQPLPTPAEVAWASILPALRQPWLPALRAIEAATEPPVHLLSLSIDPASGLVRVDGEAPSFEEAVRYAGALEAAGVLRPGRLRSHEAATDASTGRSFVRFSVQTRWEAR